MIYSRTWTISALTLGIINRLKNESNDMIGSTLGYDNGHSMSNKMASFPPL